MGRAVDAATFYALPNEAYRMRKYVNATTLANLTTPTAKAVEF